MIMSLLVNLCDYSRYYLRQFILSYHQGTTMGFSADNLRDIFF
jgi:hypothetical protein